MGSVHRPGPNGDPGGSWVAIILAFSGGLAVNLLIVAAIVKTVIAHGDWTISDNYVTMITGTLGALVGGLAVYLGRWG